jgi:hypothetical protein
MPYFRPMMFSLLFLFAVPATAETVNIPGHFAQGSGVMLPARGINMGKVLDQFGEPLQRKPAVGEPPITEWEYENFRVYFEYDTVLHAIDLTTLIMPK